MPPTATATVTEVPTGPTPALPTHATVPVPKRAPPSPTRAKWVDDLERDGFVVIPNVVSEDVALEFQEEALRWLEKFPYGFKRDDRTTWDDAHMPYSQKGGMYNRYSVNHEAFVWKIRTQPGVIGAFAEIYGTDDLIVSFDGMNASLPINAQHGRVDIEPVPAWPHIDQNPRRIDRFELYQGIANMSPNGPDDGGLVVMRGSHLLHERHFAERGGFRPEGDFGPTENSYRFDAAEWEWFKKAGCETVKVCAGVGDLIIWDSRTVHWNASPTGSQIRFCSYVCFVPRAIATPAQLAQKWKVFEARKGTSAFPHLNSCPVDRDRAKFPDALPLRPDGSLDPCHTGRPFVDPEYTPALLRLVGRG
ncbi:hypothetical protein VHUM_03574 [Vanrija humicola]|uniref:Phytanoyl-CoA dioxygenase n=1 Tax=Vanrija humicola TaxID=5417 RepID=A0A7D8YW18_VANHU|nr:hypothetical protein VHUM_03574 [Vanrija humicola]